MLDVGFSELLLLAVIGLLVLGPERLPKVARTVGYWAGRARGYVRQMTTELDREVQRAEMKQYVEESRRMLNQKIDLDDSTNSADDSKPAADDKKTD